MADWSSRNIMLTTKGAAAISKVQSGSGKLTITKVVASEQYVSESTLREVTSLSVENLPLTIIDRHEVPDGGSVIQVQLNNLDLASPFVFNEIGVFATHSDNPSEEFLYIIAQVDAETGDKIPVYGTTPVTATYDIYLYNIGADNIEVTISSSGLVTYEALNEACRMVKRSTSYAEGDIRYSSSLPIPYYLKCKVAGTTSSSSFVIPSDIEEGYTITDGTVVWEVLRLASNNEFQTAVNVLSDGIVSTNTALAESTSYGIVSGCEPSISGLTVTVGAGVVHLADGTRKEIVQTSITLDAADPTNPRIDLVYIDSTGTVAKITGTAAASPSVSALPSSGISVAQVSVAAATPTGTVADSRGMLARYYNTGIVNVKDFGAVGDGIHDDTEAIQNALNAGSTVIFPDGIYMVDAVKNLKLVSRENMHIIISPNAEVKSITTSKPNYYIFALLRCKNITIDGGGKITGDVDTHTGTDGEWGYGIQVYHSSNILIDNLEISKLWGDGVYIGDYIDGTHSENVTVRNCYIHHNRRQGISVGYGRDILIDSCLITDIAGVAPQSGIDIETEGNASTLEAQKNIRVSNTTIKNCAGYSIQVVGLMENINITDCTLDKFLVTRLSGNVSINNCNLSDEIRGDTPHDGASLTIENCTTGGHVVSEMPTTKIHGGKYADILKFGSGEIKVDDCKTGSFNSSGNSSVNNSTMTHIDISGSDNGFNGCTILKNITSTTGADAYFNDCNISAMIWESTFNILSFENCRIISNVSIKVTINQKFTLKDCSFIVTAKNWFFPVTAKDAECVFINNDFNFDAVQNNFTNLGLIGAWAKTVRVVGNVFRNANAVSFPIQCGFPNDCPCYLLQSQNNIALDTASCVGAAMGSGGKKYIINDITSQTTPS